jgi:hypothetical protein
MTQEAEALREKASANHQEDANMSLPVDSTIAYSVVDVMNVGALGVIAVVVSPEMPNFRQGSAATVRIASPAGAILEVSAVVEYSRTSVSKPVLLRFAGLKINDIPVGSKIRFTGGCIDGRERLLWSAPAAAYKDNNRPEAAPGQEPSR